MLAMVDGEFTKKMMRSMLGKEEAPEGIKPDLMKRGHIRSIFDGRYKFSRYFAPLQHNRPETMEQILQFNDLELFDLASDPKESINLAADRRTAR